MSSEQLAVLQEGVTSSQATIAQLNSLQASLVRDALNFHLLNPYLGIQFVIAMHRRPTQRCFRKESLLKRSCSRTALACWRKNRLDSRSCATMFTAAPSVLLKLKPTLRT